MENICLKDVVMKWQLNLYIVAFIASKDMSKNNVSKILRKDFKEHTSVITDLT